MTIGHVFPFAVLMLAVLLAWAMSRGDLVPRREIYPSYQPLPPLDLGPPPVIEDPTAPPVTYEDRAKWLPADIRRDIERELAKR